MDRYRAAFWEGLWFGLNPLNAWRCLCTFWRLIRRGERT
jgi:hypothetical protein